MASWKATIIKNVDSLAELSVEALLEALRNKDPAVAVFMFKTIYHRSIAWRKRLAFPDDPATARAQMEQAFAQGELSTDEYGVLIRGRDLQLKIAEHEALKERLAGLEQKLDLLLSAQSGHGGSGNESQI